MNIEVIRKIVPDVEPVMIGECVVGIVTGDGSFDYTPEGAKFLGSFKLQQVEIQIKQSSTDSFVIKTY